MTYQETHEPILVPINQAAQVIGIQPRQLREAVRDGLVPHYKLRNSIMLVSVPEVMASMKQPIMKGD